MHHLDCFVARAKGKTGKPVFLDLATTAEIPECTMLPLEGLTVIAVEQAVAAPFCSSRLADAGAHVIKVERPEGDFARGYDAAAKGQSSYFVWLNRGKDSAVIDLATREGRASLEQLIAGADVLLQNLKPGSMDKLGFALERLRKDYPKLICCTISGYGDDGPYADRKAYDLLIQAESGLASITGGPEGGAADQFGGRQSAEADGAGPSRDRALWRVQLKRRQGHLDLDPERARVEEALHRRPGSARPAQRSPFCQHGRARGQPLTHRQDRGRQFCDHDARRSAQ